MMIELVKGVALLLSIALLHRYIIQFVASESVKGQLVCGVLFGGMCVVVMSAPLEILPGVIFDPRSVVLSMAGLFSGVLGSIVAAVIAGTYRGWIGGDGAPVGISVVIVCTLAGHIFRQLNKNNRVSLSPLNLLIFGVIVHILVIGLFTQLPEGIAEKVLRSISIPLLVTFSPGVMLLGLLLADNVRTADLQKRLKARTRQAIKAEVAARSTLAKVQHKQDLIDEHAIFSETDAFGKIVSVNDLFCDVSGYSRSELIGQDHRILNSGNHPKSFFTDMWTTISTGATWSGDIENRRKDGECFWVKSTICPVFDDGGSISGYASLRTDVTDDIQRKIQATISKNEALEANAAKSRFIATMSHELRTPLNAILGFSEVIHSEAFGPLENQKYAEYIRDIHESGQVLRALIDDLLDITRLDLNTYKFSEQPIDLVAVAADITNRFSVLAKSSNITIEFSASEDVPSLLNADRKALNHVLNNFISNAVKASSSGDTVLVSVTVEGDQLVITVEDTGTGMEQETLDRLGEPFLQSSESAHISRGDSEGVGLGFYIASSLVKARGGHMDIQSTLGQGTCIKALYPIQSLSPEM